MAREIIRRRLACSQLNRPWEGRELGNFAARSAGIVAEARPAPARRKNAIKVQESMSWEERLTDDVCPVMQK